MQQLLAATSGRKGDRYNEHRGRNIASGDMKKSEFFQKKSEELKNILTNNWNHIDDLTNKFSEFQKSLDINRKAL